MLKAVGATEDAAAHDYLASFTNAEAMSALHGRSFHVEERHAVLGRFGHTPDSAFRAMYRRFELDDWLRTHVDAQTALAISTWRGGTGPVE